MGGDRGPEAVVPAALATLERDDSVNLTLVGLPDVLEQAQRQAGDRYGSRLGFKPATEVVAMDEPPADALRRKKDSSMRVAIELVKSGEADACVSSGNTGALMATARYVLEDAARYRSAGDHLGRARRRGPDLHARSRRQRRLHAGAPAAVRVDGLGRRRGHARDRAAARRVCSTSGSRTSRATRRCAKPASCSPSSGLNYVGFVEGDGIFHADVDVVVSDGFVGNVALKTMEGVARLISSFLKEEFRRNCVARHAGPRRTIRRSKRCAAARSAPLQRREPRRAERRSW